MNELESGVVVLDRVNRFGTGDWRRRVPQPQVAKRFIQPGKARA